MQVHKQRLETILQKHGANPSAHTDQVMQMLVVETAKMVSMLNDNKLRDAGLIASAQKLEQRLMPQIPVGSTFRR